MEPCDFVNPRTFMQSWPPDVHTRIQQKTEDESEILKNIQFATGMPEETVKELAEVCGSNTLYQSGQEPTDKGQILQMTVVPHDLNLESVRHQILHRKMRQENTAVKVSLFRKMKYNCLDEYMANVRPSNGEISPEFQVPTPNVILTVQVTRCIPQGVAYNTMKERESYLVLGNQSLTDLRDKIKCSSDAVIPGDYSNAIDVDPSTLQKAGDLYRSSFFFIENVFYNDTRQPDNVDYSRPILKWAKEHMPNTEMTTENMQDTQFFDLNIRIGQNYLFLHQGNCEHVVLFTDLRLLTEDDNKNPLAYPMLSVSRSKYHAVCQACEKLSAKWVVRGSPLLPSNSTLLCRLCFKSLLYTKDGIKTSNFQANHLCQYYLEK
ncbi:snRNA-activating protein complex subunit 3 [Biomphalaria glabrata]|nr:snRNA-activating protein complex subunit 3-like [Biomphalaria glabrata]